MNADGNIERIRQVVSEALNRDFLRVNVVDFKFERDTDHDDDEILRITVIFDGRARDIDPHQLSGTVRHVRPRLMEIGEKAFPVFSFVSRGDAGRLIRETA
ncbi:hypothetical protein L2D01_11150 [Hyphomonadaceae bacterium ML37]|nr:hypothetical protein L2D01_11150 [Hyphomonadaceae bacterium ML37]